MRANKLYPTCRDIGEGMYAMGTMRNTEGPAVIAVWINWQLARTGRAVWDGGGARSTDEAGG